MSNGCRTTCFGEDAGRGVGVTDEKVDLRIRILGLNDEFCIGVGQPKPGLRGPTPDDLVAKPPVVRDRLVKVVHREANAVDLAKQGQGLAHFTARCYRFAQRYQEDSAT